MELHIEQGRAPITRAATTPAPGDAELSGLVDADAALGIAENIWPHGRWRMTFDGVADHAGTTRLADRSDPMLPFAGAVLDRTRDRRAARGSDDNEQNPSSAQRRQRDRFDGDGVARCAWTRRINTAGRSRGLHREVGATVQRESWTPPVGFDAALSERAQGLLGGLPSVPTGAGHDAGVLASVGVPAIMLFVRNRTGVSHSPMESADLADCLAGVSALCTLVAEDFGPVTAP